MDNFLPSVAADVSLDSLAREPQANHVDPETYRLAVKYGDLDMHRRLCETLRRSGQIVAYAASYTGNPLDKAVYVVDGHWHCLYRSEPFHVRTIHLGKVL